MAVAPLTTVADVRTALAANDYLAVLDASGGEGGVDLSQNEPLVARFVAGRGHLSIEPFRLHANQQSSLLPEREREGPQLDIGGRLRAVEPPGAMRNAVEGEMHLGASDHERKRRQERTTGHHLHRFDDEIELTALAQSFEPGPITL
ncbi:MAG: hypothetical protein EBT09_13090, partial [Actinobacteria bacterium]|nr:hypothetical protein [Actinomycetota bacterium]